VFGFGGLSDGVAAKARFYAKGIAVDRAGNIYIGDGQGFYVRGSTLRKLMPIGTNFVVSTLAGQAGTPGLVNGWGSQANFTDPNGIGVDSVGNVYLSDQVDQYTTAFRKVTPSGVVTTLARYNHPSDNPVGWGVAVDPADNVYMSRFDRFTVDIRKITPCGAITVWASLGFLPAGLAFDPGGNLYAADSQRSIIRKLSPDGVENIFAGQSEVTGSTDGTGSEALFKYPLGLATDTNGNVYVADTDNGTIRKITPEGVVTTLAGLAGMSGNADGTGAAARFASLGGLATDAAGNIYVADGETVRKVTPEGTVTTLAGEHSDPAVQAAFRNLSGVAADGAGNLLVSDWNNNNAIFRITPEGAVSVLAGQPGVPGNVDGIGSDARFHSALILTSDVAGNLYLADNNTIRKVTADGVVTTVAGTAGASGSADGTGGAASFNSPQGAALDSSLNLYIADTGNYTVRKITPEGLVTTLAGLAGNPGTANGTGSTARFSDPSGIGVDHLRNGFRPIPTGLRPPAQGCEERYPG